jgi:hypothetical protein
MDNPYEISKVDYGNVKSTGVFYKVFLSICVLAFATIAILNMLATEYYFGANARVVIGGLFIIPAIFGIGGKIVKFIAYIYALELALSIVLYFFLMRKSGINLDDLDLYLLAAKSFLGCLVFINLGTHHKQSVKVERVEPSI